jgi:hypothetical protein
MHRKSAGSSLFGLLNWRNGSKGRLNSEGPSRVDMLANEALALRRNGIGNRAGERTIAADNLRAAVIDVETINAE